MLRLWLIAVLIALGLTGQAKAHESLPAYLGMTETAPGRFDVTMRVPATQGRPPALVPEFPAPCRTTGASHRTESLGLAITRMTVACGKEPLATGTIGLAGLESTVIDAVVQLDFLDGREITAVLRPSAPAFSLGETHEEETLAGYLRMGTEHILLGFDHLLFVAALMLLVRGFGAIVRTLTAFTIAHSITLALASLGYVHMPRAATEAVIALSIVYLAREIVVRNEGHQTFTQRKPWLIAFAFGLLHGFGFAGALADIGLPQTNIPLALLAFNLGVEFGQILFVCAVLVLVAVLRTIVAPGPQARQLAGYAIGGLSSFWLIGRLGTVFAIQ